MIKMKRFLAVILSGLMILSFAGCRSNDGTGTTGNASSAVASSDASSSVDDDMMYSIDDEAETEEMTVYTKSSKDYYWSPFGEDIIADYVTDEDGKVYFANMDSAVQILPKTGGSGTVLAVKNGGDKKKLKVTVIDGEDPDNPPQKLDENVVIDSYDPSDLNIPQTYYAKYEMTYEDYDTKYESICASTGKEYSYLEKVTANDETEVFSRYVNTEDGVVYDYDGVNWEDQGYSETAYEETLKAFKDGDYNPGTVFTYHFYGFSDIAKYYLGKETVCNIECNVFEQKIADDHYYKYWVIPDSNIALKVVECVPGSGKYTLEATSYIETLDAIPANLDLKPQ